MTLSRRAIELPLLAICIFSLNARLGAECDERVRCIRRNEAERGKYFQALISADI